MIRVCIVPEMVKERPDVAKLAKNHFFCIFLFLSAIKTLFIEFLKMNKLMLVILNCSGVTLHFLM